MALTHSVKILFSKCIKNKISKHTTKQKFPTFLKEEFHWQHE